MSTRDDARLTAQERAALSSLEANATADDPQLAVRLRGPGRWSISAHWARLRFSVRPGVPAWAISLWFAIPAVVLGLVLVVLGVALGWELGVGGAVLAVAGLTSLVRHAGRKLGPRRGPAR